MTKRYKHCTESQVTFSELMLPSHSNFGGKIHGGYILNLMDQIAFACASKHSGHYCVTASIGSVDFLNPIEIGELVTMKASINYVGRSSMVVGIRVDSENIQTGEVKHCNSSFFTMVAKEKDGSVSKDVPGLIMKNNTDIRRFLESTIRIEQRRSYHTTFDKDTFDHRQHIEKLEGQNVEIQL